MFKLDGLATETARPKFILRIGFDVIFWIVLPSAPAIATAPPERLPKASSLEYKAAALTYCCSLYAELGALAQSASIFPVALGPEANLQGEIIGSGGEVGTTFVLSGQTLGISFTLTLAQDASRVVERVAIPSRSYDLSVGCVVSAGSAICQNVVISAGVTSTPPLTTLPFSPFVVPVSTSGVLPSPISSASGSASATATTVFTSVPTSSLVTNEPTTSSASASTPVVASSVITSQVTVSASSAGVSPSASTATLASPSASQSDTSDGSKMRTFSPAVALIVPIAIALWIVK
ncbi:hypothetical protein ACEPAI_6752 [Sanghuangporus weigelae]